MKPWPIEIVALPIKDGDFPYVSLPEGNQLSWEFNGSLMEKRILKSHEIHGVCNQQNWNLPTTIDCGYHTYNTFHLNIVMGNISMEVAWFVDQWDILGLWDVSHGLLNWPTWVGLKIGVPPKLPPLS